MYKLGLWLRDRYRNILSPTYKNTEIRVNSSGSDGCLLSAQSVLAGLYRLNKTNQWYHDVPWEPIPIFTKPEIEDPVIAMKAYCKRYEYLFDVIRSSQIFQNVTKDNAELFEYLSEKTGWKINDIDYIKDLYSIFNLYRKYNNSYIPDWFNQINQTHISKLAAMAWARKTYDDYLISMKVGPLLLKLLIHTDNIVYMDGSSKFFMISMPIDSMSNLLHTMGLYNNPIDYGTAFLWEFSKKQIDGNWFNMITMYVKRNETAELEPLLMRGCGYFTCQYEFMKDMLRDFAMDPNYWRYRCSS